MLWHDTTYIPQSSAAFCDVYYHLKLIQWNHCQLRLKAAPNVDYLWSVLYNPWILCPTCWSSYNS